MLFLKTLVDRFTRMPAAFHEFSKFADVIKIISNLHMVVVDITTRAHSFFVPRIMNFYLTAIRYAEQILVMAIKKPNSFFRFFHVPIKPVSAIAVAIQVIFTLIGI